MRILFIHQNLPGQFTHPIQALIASGQHEVVGIAAEPALARCAKLHPGLKLLGYRVPVPPHAVPVASPVGAPVAAPVAAGSDAPAAKPAPQPQAIPPHPYLTDADSQVRRGQAVARVLQTLKGRGFVPDLIVAHPGWGESLFCKEIYPDAPLLGYFEFFFSATGGDVGFDPEFPNSLDNLCRLRVRNAMYLAALHASDHGITPTRWQHSRFPLEYQPRIHTLHEGVNTEWLQPDPAVSFVLNEQRFSAGEPIITFVARGLEPYRGFHIFMRALPALLRRLPQARVLIVGGDEVSYGRPHSSKKSWREVLLAELVERGEPLDPKRVHFTGKLPHDAFRKVLQVSAAHIYLTYPFVLSWSMLEAMACGALIVGSRTAPVEELIEHGRNGLLVDFFDAARLIDTVAQAIEHPADFKALRQAARETIVERYDLNRICLPATLALLNSLAR